MFLLRATHMRSQLLLGPRSSAGWTSAWFCAEERSLRCYFNPSPTPSPSPSPSPSPTPSPTPNPTPNLGALAPLLFQPHQLLRRHDARWPAPRAAAAKEPDQRRAARLQHIWLDVDLSSARRLPFRAPHPAHTAGPHPATRGAHAARLAAPRTARRWREARAHDRDAYTRRRLVPCAPLRVRGGGRGRQLRVRVRVRLVPCTPLLP